MPFSRAVESARKTKGAACLNSPTPQHTAAFAIPKQVRVFRTEQKQRQEDDNDVQHHLAGHFYALPGIDLPGCIKQQQEAKLTWLRDSSKEMMGHS